MTSAERDDAVQPNRNKAMWRRRLWLWPAWAVGAGLLLALLSFLIWPMWWLHVHIRAQHWIERPRVDMPVFYLKVHADLDFDGEPVAIDGWLACRSSLTKANREREWRTRYKISATTLGMRLTAGGAINMRVPGSQHICNRGVEGDPVSGNWRMTEGSLPDGLLPAFYWIDDADRPTRGEVYVSEGYYQQPYARLQIKSLRIGGFTETLPDGALLFDDENPPSRQSGALASPWYNLSGLVVRKIPFETWRDLPRFYAFVESLGDRQEIAQFDIEAIRNASYYRRWPNHKSPIRLGYAGIPRRGVEGGALISSWSERASELGEVLDSVTPMTCDAGWVTPLQNRTGYFPFCATPIDDPNKIKSYVKSVKVNKSGGKTTEYGLKGIIQRIRGINYKGQRIEHTHYGDPDMILYDPEDRTMIVFLNFRV